MKRPEKTFLLIAFPVIFFIEGLTAQVYDIKNILSEPIIKELTENGEVKNTLEKGKTELSLTPNTDLSKKTSLFKGGEDDENPSFISEALYIVKKEDLNNNKNLSIEEVSKVLRSISKMKGMEYYSNTKQKWATLYSESYMVDNPNSTERIPDKTDGSADGLKLYCFQNEHSFGESIYELTYHQNENEVYVMFQNLDDLKYKFIKAVKKGNMNINLVVMDCGDSFLVYMVIQARVIRWSFLEKRMNKSLNARIDALYKWFVKQF